MKTILVTAYAVNPYKGSEDGTGWNWLLQIAKNNRVIAITRKNNQKAIEQFFDEHPQKTTIQFYYFDLPKWLYFWKRKEKGALLYYQLWLIGVAIFSFQFRKIVDIAHHLNFHNDYMPPFLWLLRKPFVWGPIGHHPAIPFNYAMQYGFAFALVDQFRFYAKKFYKFINPFYWMAIFFTEKIIAINSQSSTALNKNVVIPAVAANPQISKAVDNSKFTVLFVGRFENLKGVDIALDSFIRCYNSLYEEDKDKIEMIFIGKGTLYNHIKKKLHDNNLFDTIKMYDWMPQQDVLAYFNSASVFFFPSFEGAGMVVPEALSFRLPVVCFDNEGPGELSPPNSKLKIKYTTREKSVADFAKILSKLFYDKSFLNDEKKIAIDFFDSHLSWDVKGLQIQKIYDEIC